MSWVIEGTSASWNSSAGRLMIDLSAPQLGCRVSPPMRPEAAARQEVWGALFGNLIAPVPVIEEAYFRGNDLIVHYAEADETRLSTTLYYRIFADPMNLVSPSLGLELVIATRTSTLGTQPVAEVRSIWPIQPLDQWVSETPIHSPESPLRSHELDSPRSSEAHPLTWLSQVSDDLGSDESGSVPNWLALLSSGESRFTWIHPSDGAVDLGTSQSHRSEVLHSLELQLLEKGVIRSARVRFMHLGEELSIEQLKAIADACFDAALPLST